MRLHLRSITGSCSDTAGLRQHVLYCSTSVLQSPAPLHDVGESIARLPEVNKHLSAGGSGALSFRAKSAPRCTRTDHYLEKANKLGVSKNASTTNMFLM